MAINNLWFSAIEVNLNWLIVVLRFLERIHVTLRTQSQPCITFTYVFYIKNGNILACDRLVRNVPGFVDKRKLVLSLLTPRIRRPFAKRKKG